MKNPVVRYSYLRQQFANSDDLWVNLFQPIFENSNVQNIEESKKTLQMLVREKYIIGKCIWFFYTCIICVTMSTFFMIY